MIKLFTQFINSLRKDGLNPTLSRTNYIISRYLIPVILPVYDMLISGDNRDVTIKTRVPKPGSDTFGLLEDAKNSGRTVHILSAHPIDESQLSAWEGSYTAPSNLIDYFRAIAHSDVVFFTSDGHALKFVRLLDKSNRRYARIYHGPITKSYGRADPDSNPDVSRLNLIPNEINILNTSIRYRSVGSDIERYYRSSAEGVHPKKFRKWGYPRYDRLYRLIENKANPVLPDNTAEILESGSGYTNIIYATTHKTYPTTFFPFLEFDIDRLREWCRTNDVRIFLRPHPANTPDYKHLIDNEIVYFAGQEFAGSPTEIMPFMDVMITDYSSIYIPYLIFDRPLIFVKDQHNRYIQEIGLGFDYDQYFPGPKPETFEEFLLSLEKSINGQENNARQREFVRRTFIPEDDQSFLDACLNDTEVKHRSS